MLKTSELCIVEIPLRVRLGRICLELVTFLFMLIPSFLTLYLTDEMIEKGKTISYAWVVFVILMNIPVRQHRKSGRRETVCPGLRKPLMRVYSRNVLSKP